MLFIQTGRLVYVIQRSFFEFFSRAFYAVLINCFNDTDYIFNLNINVACVHEI